MVWELPISFFELLKKKFPEIPEILNPRRTEKDRSKWVQNESEKSLETISKQINFIELLIKTLEFGEYKPFYGRESFEDLLKKLEQSKNYKEMEGKIEKESLKEIFKEVFEFDAGRLIDGREALMETLKSLKIKREQLNGNTIQNKSQNIEDPKLKKERLIKEYYERTSKIMELKKAKEAEIDKRKTEEKQKEMEEYWKENPRDSEVFKAIFPSKSKKNLKPPSEREKSVPSPYERSDKPIEKFENPSEKEKSNFTHKKSNETKNEGGNIFEKGHSSLLPYRKFNESAEIHENYSEKNISMLQNINTKTPKKTFWHKSFTELFKSKNKTPKRN